MAPVLAKSGMFGMMRPETAAVTMLKGYELGLSFTAAFELVQVVQGKASLSPRGALALLHNSPEIVQPIILKRLVDKNGAFEGYECTINRVNGFGHTARFTLADAKRAGLIKAGGAWESYPENMAMYRAIGFAADVVAPDITAGMTMFLKAPEQFGVGINDAGDIVESVATQVPMTQYEYALEQLLAQHDADAILTANNGNMPATLEEVERLARVLNRAAMGRATMAEDVASGLDPRDGMPFGDK
jgi:hypothetical protein